MATNWRGQYNRYKQISLNFYAAYKQRGDVKAFLEIILSLSTLTVFTIFALKPTILTMIGLNKEIQEKQNTLNALNQKISDLQTANNVMAQYQNTIPDINSAIFTEPRPDIVSAQILGLSLRDSVKISSLSIGQINIKGGKPPVTPASTGTELKQFPEEAVAMNVSISISGSYTNLLLFLKDLELLRIPVKIDNVSISSPQIKTGGDIVEIITARIPYLKQNK